VPPLPATVVMIPARVNFRTDGQLVRKYRGSRIINGHASRLSQSCESPRGLRRRKAGTARAATTLTAPVASSFSTRELKVSEM